MQLSLHTRARISFYVVVVSVCACHVVRDALGCAHIATNYFFAPESDYLQPYFTLSLSPPVLMLSILGGHLWFGLIGRKVMAIILLRLIFTTFLLKVDACVCVSGDRESPVL